MDKVKDKRILKKIAQEWVKGILLGCEALYTFHETIITDDEANYIQKEVEKIAERITSEQSLPTIEQIINKYFTQE